MSAIAANGGPYVEYSEAQVVDLRRSEAFLFDRAIRSQIPPWYTAALYPRVLHSMSPISQLDDASRIEKRREGMIGS